MSEVQSRPSAPRGRGSARGGRGGFSTRGGGRTAARSAGTNGTTQHDTESSSPALEDEGEISELRKLYGQHIVNIKNIVSDWTDADILYALRETDGDPDEAAFKILDGTFSKWNEVSKPVKTKAKNDTFTTTTADSGAAGGLRNARGGRVEGGRGRGRVTERGGRGGGRGKSIQASTNGPRVKENQPLSVPTEESNEWDTSAPTAESNEWTESTPAESAPAPAAVEPTPAAAPAKPSTDAPKTWASMLRQSTTPKPAPKPKEVPAPPPAEPTPVIEPLPPAPAEPEVVPEPEIAAPVEEKEEPVPEPVQEEQPAVVVPVIEPVIPVVPVVPAVAIPEVALSPSKDALTDENLDKVPGTTEPPATETARSEAADSWDPRAAGSATATPLSASQQQHQAERTPSSGFAATATKATTRTPAFPRRVLDQLEAVRMPGNRAEVERTTVQFGAFSLNGGIEDDIDGDREEPETRPQPPQDSPVAQPRASLPPVQAPAAPESFPTPTQKPVSQVPTGPAGMASQTSPAVLSWLLADTNLAAAPAAVPAITPVAAPAPQPAAQHNQQQYGRFGQQTAAQEHSSFPPSKPFDSFGQQQPAAASTQSQFEGGFQGQTQPAAPTQNQQQAFSSAPNDYPSYYTSGDQRGFYGGYNYNQQQGSQDGPSSQAQRFGGYGTTQTDNISQYPQSGAQHGQSRFGSGSAPSAETPTTTAPATSASSALPQAGQTSQTQHGQQPQPDQYPYHPYSNSPYYGGYMGGYGQYGQGGYAPYGKGNVGYQPNQYGVASQGPYGYSNPSAGFGQSALHRETGGAAAGAGAGLGDYGRAGSQSAQQQSGFGGMHDAFSRGASGYQSQAASFNAPGTQPGAVPSAVDDIKSFGDAKGAAGPSPSLGVAARPGSAANNGPSQSGLPPPQSAQQTNLGGMGQYGYPGHMQQGHAGLHGSHTAAGGYGMSATGGQSQQSSYGYGNQGFGGGYYGGNSQPRGWGNNYHH
ncbi:RNAPII degradation factor [Podospora pseudopauciseta]|uniref:RNAPII degradation factor n=1 Tax=Podospora pseudopauciseta TaxID=2093780 RepID=A0ABR0H6J0_9PEZI|nr:RNAPII degradation factor [Podospora pseudopauciseta]